MVPAFLLTRAKQPGRCSSAPLTARFSVAGFFGFRVRMQPLAVNAAHNRPEIQSRCSLLPRAAQKDRGLAGARSNRMTAGVA
jgi:hypothetical protein